MIGLPASRRPAPHSSDSPDPFGPPSGSGISATFGSVDGLPLRSIAMPGGSDSPRRRALMMRPSEITLVAVSTTSGFASPPGTAIDSGLVATPAARAP